MTVQIAIQRAMDQFPFKGYMSLGVGAYSTIANSVMRHLKPGSTILDFGCGPCDKTAVLQFMGFNCSGYDDLQDDWHNLSSNREKILAFAKGCGINFKQPTAAGGPFPFDKGSFDMVMLNHVLEHIHDSPRDLLNDLLELTKPDGMLLVTVPNAVNIRKRIDVLRGRTNLPRFEGFYWYPGPWRGHVREYVRDDLVRLCEYLTLEMLELQGVDNMLQKLPKSIRRTYLLVTSLFRGWKDSWLLVAKKKPGWAPKKTLPRTERDRILGKGTSYDYGK